MTTFNIDCSNLKDMLEEERVKQLVSDAIRQSVDKMLIKAFLGKDGPLASTGTLKLPPKREKSQGVYAGVLPTEPIGYKTTWVPKPRPAGEMIIDGECKRVE